MYLSSPTLKALALTVFAVGLSAQLARPIWYDEAFTLLCYVNAFDPSAIYWKYEIPNNHIGYSILLGFAGKLLLTPVQLRLLSAVLLLSGLLLLFRHKREGLPALLLALSTLWLGTWEIYGTAIRGYAFSFLAVALALRCALAWHRRRAIGSLFLFSVSALAAVAAIPSNLIALVAVCALTSPSLRQTAAAWRAWACLPAISGFVFIAFYLPIWADLIRNLSIRDGWVQPWHAVGHLYVAFALAVLCLLPPLLRNVYRHVRFALVHRTHRARLLVWLTILSLPLPVLLLHDVAPFPRVFFCLWPVWIFLALRLSRLRAPRPRTSVAASLCALGGIVLLVQGGAAPLKTQLSKAITPAAAQDDFAYPYYMRESFAPMTAVDVIVKIEQGLHPGEGQTAVVTDNDADPWSIRFYSEMSTSTATRTLQWHPPYQGGDRAYLIVRSARALPKLLERIGAPGARTLQLTPDPPAPYHEVFLYDRSSPPADPGRPEPRR